MMEMMAQEFPGAFSGYNLSVTESHQRTKADTSGTAKAVVGSLQRLGLDLSEVSLFCLATQTIPLSSLKSRLSMPHGYIAFG
jgi:dihydrodipicolinate reductase